MIDLVNWFFNKINYYTDDLKEFAKKIKENNCKKIKGEYFCKPLFFFQSSLVDNLQEEIMGEAYYIRLTGCEGKRKIIYTELIKVKVIGVEEIKKDDLILILINRIKKLEKLLDPYKVGIVIVENLNSIFGKEKLVPKEKIKAIFKKHKNY